MPKSSTHARFLPVETIVDEDGVVRADITEDAAHDRFTYMIYREYPAGGEVKRTSYFRAEHGGAMRRILILVERAITRLEEARFAETRRHGTIPK
jgi:hypothetical protein